MDRIPVLRLGEVLLVSIQVDLQDHVALALQDDLSARIVQTGARGVLIDISALEIVDSFIGRMLATMASISRLLDADTVVVGMRPAVAITLVELGLSLGGVHTALDVDKGLALLGATPVVGADGEQAPDGQLPAAGAAGSPDAAATILAAAAARAAGRPPGQAPPS
jgi:rsbT antagonist protein RsbS